MLDPEELPLLQKKVGHDIVTERRDDAARRRRQGRRRGDHGRGRVPEGAPGARARADPGLLHRRRGGRGRGRPPRPRPLRRQVRLHARRRRARRDRGGDVQRLEGRRHDPRPLDAPRHGEGPARERDQARRRLRRGAAAGRALARDDRGARRVRPPDADLGRCRRDVGRADRPRPRRGEDGGAHGPAPAARRRGAGARAARVPSRSPKRSSTGTWAR